MKKIVLVVIGVALTAGILADDSKTTPVAVKASESKKELNIRVIDALFHAKTL